jgi:TorA maturation chaperone TorD
MIGEQTLQLKEAIACADLCSLISVAFDAPTIELAEGLRNGSFESDFRGCLEELGEGFPEGDSLFSPYSKSDDATDLFAQMQREYSHLYLQPGKLRRIYPYESCFLHIEQGRGGVPTLFISPVTHDVETWMRKFGALPVDARVEPVDHIAKELDFLRLLFTNYANALLNEDAEKDGLFAECESFMQKHISNWVPQFLDRTQQESQGSIYGDLAAFSSLALQRIQTVRGV